MKNLYICKHENGHGYCLLNDEYCPQSPCKDEEIITYAPVKQEWISVKDRLPSYFVSVLLWDAMDEDIFMGELDGDGEWFVRGYSPDDFNITHWMPLPEPPEREGE